MSVIWWRAKKPGSSTVYDENGNLQTVTLDEGEAFETSDPCQALTFISNWSADDGDRSYTEETPGLVKSLEKACSGAGETIVVTGSGSAQPPEASDGVPSDGDDPSQQGSPEVESTGQLSWEGPSLDELFGFDPSDLAFDQQNPLPVEEILVSVASGDLTPEEANELMDRWAHNQPQPGRLHPTHSGETAREPTQGGDPVDLFRGLLTLIKVDLEVPAAVLPLALVRTYRSGRPYFGPWGFGWDHNYNVYLRELTDGGVAWWTGGLHESLFRWTGSAYEPERGVHGRLEALAQPHAYLLTRSGGQTLRFERPFQWTDDERIPLLEIRDRHGNTQDLTYDAENRLQRVEDQEGRALIFHYGTCGLLEGLSDHAGRFVRYDHHPNIEHLVKVVLPPTATYPNGAAVGYEYDEGASHPAMRHNLVRIVDPDGLTYVETEYGGPENGWAFNRVVRQLYGGFLYEYEYEQVQYVPADAAFVNVPALRTAIRSPDGSLTTHTFNYRGDLLDRRLRLNLDSSYRIVAWQWEYDEQGNHTSEVRPDGGRTAYTYDAANLDPCARGNLLKIELFAPPAYIAASRVILEATYDPVYQLPIQVVDETHAITTFVYDFDTNPGPGTTGRLERIDLPDTTLPDGTLQKSSLHVETNARGQVTALISPEDSRNELHYYGTGPAASLLERSVEDAADLAFETIFEYDAMGYPRRTTTPLAVVTETRYNALGQLEEVVFPAVGGVTAMVRQIFTLEDQPLCIESPRGDYEDDVLSGTHIVDEFVRDVLGQVVEAVVGANTARPRRWRFANDHEGRVVETEDPVGMRIRRGYDERGLLLSERLAAGEAEELETRFAYDRAGHLMQREEPGGIVTRIFYDPWGRVDRIELPNGSKRRQTWGAGDRLVEVRMEGDPGDGGPPRLLSRFRFDYDERGRLVRETVDVFRDDPAVVVERKTEYFYDKDDRLREVHEPLGGVIRYEYNGLDRLKRVEDVLGNVVRIYYTAAGDLDHVDLEEVEPAGGTSVRTWTYVYDERHRLRSIAGPSGEALKVDYDDRDLLIERQEPPGPAVRFRYGLLGELEEEVLDPSGLALEVRLENDLLGRSVRYIDPTKEATHWKRDLLGRIVSTTLADGSVWTRQYGPSGALKRAGTPSGSEIILVEEEGTGRLAGVTCTPGAGVLPTPSQTFGYDGLDRLVSATVPGHIVSRRYDSLGRHIEESARGRSIYVYYEDLMGTLDLVLPDGRIERVETDLSGRPNRFILVSPGTLGGAPGSLIAKLIYGASSRLLGIEHGNGVVTEIAYDEAGRPVRVAHQHAGIPLESCRYRYDALGRRRVAQLLGTPQRNTVHDFDAAGRLTGSKWDFPLADLADAVTQAEHDAGIALAQAAAAGALRSETFAVDDADVCQLRTRVDGGTVVTSYSYESGHRMTAAGTEAIGHHPDGPRTSDGERLYDIDALGRISQVRDAATSAVLATFQYDAMSRLAGGMIGGQPFERWYLGASWLHEEDPGGSVLRQRVEGPLSHVPLVQISPTGALVPLVDGGLSVLGVTDVDGQVVERARFEPFGKPTVLDGSGSAVLPSSAVGFEPTFGGMPYLSNLGLYWTDLRLYEPEHGVFLARDPWLYDDSPSPYVYARHNPVDLVDPTGEWVESAWDGFSLGLGVYSFAYNVQKGNVGWAVLDGFGIVVDTAALILPFVPGGVGVAIKTFRGAKEVAEFTRVGGRVLDATELAQYGQRVDRVARSAQAINSGVNVAQSGYGAYEHTSKGEYGSASFNVAISLLGVRGLATRGPVLSGHQTMGGNELVTRFRGSREYKGFGSLPEFVLGSPMPVPNLRRDLWNRFQHSLKSPDPPRPFESVTRNPQVAFGFAKGGEVIRFQVRRADLLPTPSLFHLKPFSGANRYEAEHLVRGGTKIFNVNVVKDLTQLHFQEKLEIWMTRVERGAVYATVVGGIAEGVGIGSAYGAELPGSSGRPPKK